MGTGTTSGCSKDYCDGSIDGGGIIGIYSRDTNGELEITTISNSIFYNNIIHAGTSGGDSFHGGGIIGNMNSNLAIGNISGTIFANNYISTYSIIGGGIIGKSGGGDFSIGDINNSYFSNNEIIADSYNSRIMGGGIIGISFASDLTYNFGAIKNSFFNNNIIKGSIMGGGIIGLFADNGWKVYGGNSSNLIISEISNTSFNYNEIYPRVYGSCYSYTADTSSARCKIEYQI